MKYEILKNDICERVFEMTATVFLAFALMFSIIKFVRK